MALLNRILNVLIILAAGVAVLYALKLDQRRTALVAHSEQLAKQLADVTKQLDENSNTDVASKFTDDKIGWKAFSSGFDPAAGDTPGFSTQLAAASKHAQEVRAHRDALGQVIKEVGAVFGEEVELEQLTSIAEFEAVAANVKQELESSRKREKEIASMFEKLALDVGFNGLDEDSLLDEDRYRESVDDFSTHVTTINKRADSYMGAIKDITSKIDMFEFQMNPAALDDPEQLEHELTALREDYAGLNEQLMEFDRARTELVEKEKDVHDQRKVIEDLTTSKTELETQMLNLHAEKKVLDKALKKCRNQRPKELISQGSQVASLSGNVISVNYEWNYVIIDIGARKQLAEDTQFRIARGTEFICNVRVSRVFEDYAVAEIENGLINGKVLEGDRVIL